MFEERRKEFHKILVDILGSEEVHYQPPSTVTLVYPCIIYQRFNIDTKYADNGSYIGKTAYNVMIIDRSPDSPVLDELYGLPFSNYDRHYTQDQLNHDIFTIFY